MIGLLLNMSHFTCPSCSDKHELFGSSAGMLKASQDMNLQMLGQLPLVPTVSQGGDLGRPVMVQSDEKGNEVRQVMHGVGKAVWEYLGSRPVAINIGIRG